MSSDWPIENSLRNKNKQALRRAATDSSESEILTATQFVLVEVSHDSLRCDLFLASMVHSLVGQVRGVYLRDNATVTSAILLVDCKMTES